MAMNYKISYQIDYLASLYKVYVVGVLMEQRITTKCKTSIL